MMLAAANLYSSLEYFVLAINPKAGQLVFLRPDRGEAMQDAEYGSSENLPSSTSFGCRIITVVGLRMAQERRYQGWCFVDSVGK
jgi:hypothetical protein